MISIIIHYQEIALKGRNRPWFIHSLVRSVRAALGGLSLVQARAVVGRIEARMSDDGDWPEARARLAVLPGIANFGCAIHVEPSLDAICEALLPRLSAYAAPASFRIAARRADKRFPIPSPDIEREIGRRVQQATGWRVDLSNPAFKIHVEVLTTDAFFYFEKERGAGGLPSGTSGRVMCLLSGGIDSPVAAWRVIRRGCRAHFVHFHSYPILSRTSQDKARELVRLLTRRQLRSRLFLVPFGAAQQQVLLAVPPPMRVIVYRRLMVRIAERIARRRGAHALVTGDVIGQVASQTIENLAAVEAAATMPILRPLIGVDKEEITAEAERIGSYATSIVPDEDCCTLFTPRFPATKATLAAAEAAERGLDVEAMVAAAVEAAVVEDFQYPVVRSGALSKGESRGDRP